MSVPFNPARVSRFLAFFFLALAVVWIVYILLTNVRAGQSILTHHAGLQLPSPGGVDFAPPLGAPGKNA